MDFVRVKMKSILQDRGLCCAGQQLQLKSEANINRGRACGYGLHFQDSQAESRNKVECQMAVFGYPPCPNFRYSGVFPVQISRIRLSYVVVVHRPFAGQSES